MKTALVILNWNGEKLLREYLPTVLKHCKNGVADVVVADNNSTDNSMQTIAELFPELTTISLDKNYGFAEGYNKALSQLKEYDVYILCNSDIMLKSDAVTPLINEMEKDPQIAVVSPKIKSLLHPEDFEYAGAAGGFIDKFGYPFCRGRIINTIEQDRGQYNENSEIFWASGAFMAVRSSVYHQLGGLDASFFAHMEEIDFCWRAKNNGYKIAYCSNAEVFHLGGATLNQGNPRKLYLNFRNSLWMMLKNLPSNCLVIRMLTRMTMDGASALAYLLQLKPKYFWAVFKAHIALYTNLARLWQQRKLHSIPHTKIPTGMLNGSIIWHYYVKKHKTFFPF